MNWKELYALVNENIKNAVSGLYKPAGDITFAELPELSQSVLGYTYTVTDAFTTDNRFTDYDTETQTGHSFPADTEVAVIVTGTTENPVYMFNVMGGIMDGYATKGDLDNYVEKEAGKSLSTNDYTNADKALVQDSPITVSATGSDLTLSTAEGKVNTLTIYGKSEVVDGAITSAGEGWATVDLGTLNWTKTPSSSPQKTNFVVPSINNAYVVSSDDEVPHFLCNEKQSQSYNETWGTDTISQKTNGVIWLTTPSTITDETELAAWFADNPTYLAYELADPTQGNCIAVKTDNGTGINGTMATFTTGTPLREIPDTTVRDVMAWDGSTGTITKKCAEVRLADLTWTFDDQLSNQNRSCFFVVMTDMTFPTSTSDLMPLICNGLTVVPQNLTWAPGQVSCQNQHNRLIVIVEPTITTEEQLKTHYAGLEFIYERATPTTEQLTSAENASIAGLRTFEPQTHAQNNAQTDMTVKAYAGTANGKAVQELKQDVQSEISALKITQSDTLTLTTAGWANNAQTVTYAHDTAKRNVIDVDPSSVEEWAGCGVLATAETATSITFSCKTVPENALTFRVTSMGV